MIYVCTLNPTKDIALDGKDCIKDLNELYSIVTSPNCTGLEIRKDFVREYLTPTSINALVNEIKKLKPNIHITTEIDYWEEKESSLELLDIINDPEDFVNWILANKEESMRLYQQLVQEHNEEVSDRLEANAKISNLSSKYIELESRLREEKGRSEYLKTMLERATAKYNSLVGKINMNYNIGITDSYMETINLEMNTYQKILYIKEITRVKYVDSFIYYLQEILKTLYTVPARLLVLESAFAYDKARLYPNCKNHMDMTVQDAFSGDIFCAGASPFLINDVLKNSSRYPYLIILDRTGWRDNIVQGKDVETYYTVSDLNDMSDRFYQDLDHIISYNEQTLYINYIEGFDDLDIQAKMSKYSSMDIMIKTINLLEGNVNNA